MPLPLIPIAAALLPELVRLLAGDRAGTAAAQVAAAVRTVTGTDDPTAAQALLAADPVKTAELRARLAEIALEGERARLQAQEKRRAAELAELQARLGDAQSARGGMLALAGQGSAIAWGAPLMSAIITLGFFTVVLALALGLYRAESQLLNIVIGALVAAFTAVVNFWLGSSQGSREKDAAVQRLGVAQAAQAEAAIRGLQQVAEAGSRPPAEDGATPVAFRDAAPPATARAAEETFRACLAVVLRHEGGFSDHPLDRGGPTNLGITLATLAAFRGRAVTAGEVAALTEEEAREIYRSRYWVPLRCAEMPPGVELSVFDYGVNAGIGTAARELQRAVGVTPDGSIGPITLAALRAADAEELIARIAARRQARNEGLANFATFGRGWTRRVAEVREEAQRRARAGGVPALRNLAA